MSDFPDSSTSPSAHSSPTNLPHGPAALVAQSPNSTTAKDSSTGEGGQNKGAPQNRRRGSRGGRKRRPVSASGSDETPAEGSETDDRITENPASGKPDREGLGGPETNGAQTLALSMSADQAEYDRRPADLPDSPFEGVASPEAAARAEVRPRIGDSRPARVLSTSQAGPQGRRLVDPTDRDRVEYGADGVDGATNVASEGTGTNQGHGGAARKSRRNRSKILGESTERPELETPSGPRPSRSQRIAAALGDESSTAETPVAGLGEGRSSQRQTKNARTNQAAFTNQNAGGSSGSEEPKKGRRGGNTPKGRGRVNTTAEPIERPRGRERNGRPVGRFLMCVHAHPKATQIAVLEGRSLIEHYVSRPTDNANQIHGNIYLGRVQNVLPGMEAAFVDIGTPKNAVVYRGDLQFDAGDIETSGKKKDDVRIEQVLKNRQLVLCQVTKNPIGSKGARLTQDVSIPGRFVVLVPNSDTYGISKRLGDDERKRLRRILDEIRPEKHGLIVRTAAEGATPDELQRDVALLLRQWEAIEAKAKKANSPMLLHKEPDMAVRVIREEFNQNYRGIVIDDRDLYEEVRSYVESISPELADRVEFHDSAIEPLPLFEKHHVHEQLHKAIDRKVWLPSGGSLIIERTEALTVIDVNTGKNVGSSSLEETVFRNNLEAADEIARQLRLRDIGGIVVIDFIDMEIRANREAVIGTFRDALSRDKTRTQVFDISELGLVEMTRKRISEGLVESLSEGCPTCAGRGFTFDSDLID